MSEAKINLGINKLSKALTSLEQISFKPMQEDRSNIDATIQRFEFTIELFWKLLKVILEEKGIEATYPKEILKLSFSGNLIDHQDIWLKMLLDRNLTSHTYDEELSNQVFSRIQTYVPILRAEFDKLISIL